MRHVRSVAALPGADHRLREFARTAVVRRIISPARAAKSLREFGALRRVPIVLDDGGMLAMSNSRRSPDSTRQLDLFRHGGKRRGAGRKPKGPNALVSHVKREPLAARHPVHVT